MSKWWAFLVGGSVLSFVYDVAKGAIPVLWCTWQKCMGQDRGAIMIATGVGLVVLAFGLWLLGEHEKHKERKHADAAAEADRKRVDLAQDVHTLLTLFEFKLRHNEIAWGPEQHHTTDQAAIQPLRRIVGAIRETMGDARGKEIDVGGNPNAPAGVLAVPRKGGGSDGHT